jgi:hypothetical protein
VTLIGSGRECRLRCTDAGVDRRHYALFWLAGALYGVDLHRARQNPHAPLGCWWNDATRVDIGPFQLQATGIAQTADRDVGERWSASPVRVHWTAGEQTHAEGLHARLTLIGSGRDCSIRLSAVQSAPVQAALVRTPRSLALFHLADNDWTRQHGLPIERALLEPGDEFQIGTTTFHVATIWDEHTAVTPSSSWRDFLEQQADRVAELQALLDRLRSAPPQNELPRELLDRVRELSAACGLNPTGCVPWE